MRNRGERRFYACPPQPRTAHGHCVDLDFGLLRGVERSSNACLDREAELARSRDDRFSPIRGNWVLLIRVCPACSSGLMIFRKVGHSFARNRRSNPSPPPARHLRGDTSPVPRSAAPTELGGASKSQKMAERQSWLYGFAPVAPKHKADTNVDNSPSSASTPRADTTVALNRSAAPARPLFSSGSKRETYEPGLTAWRGDVCGRGAPPSARDASSCASIKVSTRPSLTNSTYAAGSSPGSRQTPRAGCCRVISPPSRPASVRPARSRSGRSGRRLRAA